MHKKLWNWAMHQISLEAMDPPRNIQLSPSLPSSLEIHYLPTTKPNHNGSCPPHRDGGHLDIPPIHSIHILSYQILVIWHDNLTSDCLCPHSVHHYYNTQNFWVYGFQQSPHIKGKVRNLTYFALWSTTVEAQGVTIGNVVVHYHWGNNLVYTMSWFIYSKSSVLSLLGLWCHIDWSVCNAQTVIVLLGFPKAIL